MRDTVRVRFRHLSGVLPDSKSSVIDGAIKRERYDALMGRFLLVALVLYRILHIGIVLQVRRNIDDGYAYIYG